VDAVPLCVSRVGHRVQQNVADMEIHAGRRDGCRRPDPVPVVIELQPLQNRFYGGADVDYLSVRGQNEPGSAAVRPVMPLPAGHAEPDRVQANRAAAVDRYRFVKRAVVVALAQRVVAC
jgi:hypothetical protein